MTQYLIEDLPVLSDIEVTVAVPAPVREVYLAPQGMKLPFHQENGRVHYTLPPWSCHQMVVLQF